MPKIKRKPYNYLNEHQQQQLNPRGPFKTLHSIISKCTALVSANKLVVFTSTRDVLT